MPRVTIPVFNAVHSPGNSLALWLAFHHPDLFLAMFKQAQTTSTAKQVRKSLGRFADDGGTDFPGITPFTSDATLPTLDLTSTPDISTAIEATPITPVSEEGLTAVTIDPSTQTLPANLISDGSAAATAVAATPTSSGASLGNTLGSSVTSVLGSVGSFLNSQQGRNALTTASNSYFASQTQTANLQAQQALFNTQLNRAKAGQQAAPITYQVGANGQYIPVYATQTPQGTVYSPLNSAGLASLTPSSIAVFLNQYGTWLIVAAAALLGLSALS